jgi:hypothetical protein
MKSRTKILVIGGLILVAGILYYWTNIATKSGSSITGLIGKTVKAKYTGTSEPDLPIGGADMPSPMKNGEILQGIISE